MTTIIPAILATTEKEYREFVEEILASKTISEGWIHFDVADNIFTPNRSIGLAEIADYDVLKKLKAFKKEVHLMVEKPAPTGYIVNGFDRVVVHFEAVEDDDPDSYIQEIKTQGEEAGLAIELDTPLEKVVSLLRDIDLLLLMAVEPGFQGQIFHREVLEKVEQAVDLRKRLNLKFQIGVDGGVSAENAKLLVKAGADNLVVGSHLIKGDIDENFKKIREAI